MDEPLTRHQRKLLKKQTRVEQQVKGQSWFKLHRGGIIRILVMLAVVGAAVYGVRRIASTSQGETYTQGPVHWHAKLELEVCGEKRDLPGPQDGRMVGNHLYHHHGDNTWHLEGRIIAREDIKLGRFFEEHKIMFDRDQLFDKKNGDECAPGKPGQVKMLVNGESNEEFRDYVGQYTPDAKDHLIRIVFE